MARDSARLKSDWNAWAAGSRGVEVERLEQELAELRASERRARLEAAEARERFERLLDASRRFTRTLSDRRRQQQTSRQYLTVQHAIDGVLAEAAGLEDAAAGVLKTLGENLGCQGAVLWVAVEETLRCVEVWHRPHVAPDGFGEAYRRTRCARGEGLPGSAWAQNRPVWAGDSPQEKRFAGEADSSEGGLHITSEEVSGYVEDDGSGFAGNGETQGGLGLRSIRERAALLEGTAEVYASQKGGAGVQVCLSLRNGVG